MKRKEYQGVIEYRRRQYKVNLWLSSVMVIVGMISLITLLLEPIINIRLIGILILVAVLIVIGLLGIVFSHKELKEIK